MGRITYYVTHSDKWVLFNRKLNLKSVVKEIFHEKEADRILLHLLDSPDCGVVQSILGILINFSLSSDCTPIFLKFNEEGFHKLLAVMTEFFDWALATLGLQIFWNLLRLSKEVRFWLLSLILFRISTHQCDRIFLR